MPQYRFVVRDDFVDFYDGSMLVTTLRNSSQEVNWFYNANPGIGFEIDGFRYKTENANEIEIDGVTLSSNSDFDTKIVEIFPNLLGGSGGGGGFTGLFFEPAATFAAISADTTERLIKVAADETNNGDKSLYIHDGTDLLFLQTIA